MARAKVNIDSLAVACKDVIYKELRFEIFSTRIYNFANKGYNSRLITQMTMKNSQRTIINSENGEKLLFLNHHMKKFFRKEIQQGVFFPAKQKSLRNGNFHTGTNQIMQECNYWIGAWGRAIFLKNKLNGQIRGRCGLIQLTMNICLGKRKM